MMDSLYDPKFPDRPNTPDFWRLSEISLAHDAAAIEDDALVEELKDMVDLDSLIYVAQNRIATALGPMAILIPENLRTVVVAAYLDAFAKGVEFQRRGGHRD